MKALGKWIGVVATVSLIAGCATTDVHAFDEVSESAVYELRERGESSGDLRVQIEIEADADRDNSSEAAQFETDVEVKVHRGGVAVRDATVTLVAYDGPTMTLRHDDDGEYEGEIRGYHRAYRVDVVAGEDRLEGVYLAGPAIHYFTSPGEGDQVARGDIEVEWNTGGAEADEAWLEGEEFEAYAIDQSGTVTVGAQQLNDDDDEELEIKRINRMDLAGAPGSTMTIEVKNEIEFGIR